jgi:hypothetical protein
MCLLIPLISTCGHTALYFHSCITRQTTFIGRADDPYRTHEEDFPILLEHRKGCSYTTLDISYDTCLPSRCNHCITTHNTELIWARRLDPARRKRLALYAAVRLCSFSQFYDGGFMPETEGLVFKRQADWRFLNDVIDKLDQILYYRDEIHERERAKAETTGDASGDKPLRDLGQDAIARFVFRVAQNMEASKVRYHATKYQILKQMEEKGVGNELDVVRDVPIEEVAEEDRQCGIWRCTIGVPDDEAGGRVEKPVITGCKHVFGDFCLTQWANESDRPGCPLCRTRIGLTELTIEDRIEEDITHEEDEVTEKALCFLREVLENRHYNCFDHILTRPRLARYIYVMITSVGLPR